MVSRRSMRWILAACCAVPASSLFAQLPSIEMKNDYIWTAINNAGALGTGGSTSPGLIYDPTGTGNFDVNTDYIIPGDPFEGFSVKVNGTISTTITTPSRAQKSAPFRSPISLEPTATPAMFAGSAATTDYGVTNDYYFNKRDQRIYIKTSITATNDLTAVQFLRTIDPDPDVLKYGSYDTVNTRGLGTTVPASNYVEGLGSQTGRRVALYSTSPITHNTMVSADWSKDPPPPWREPMTATATTPLASASTSAISRPGRRLIFSTPMSSSWAATPAVLPGARWFRSPP